MLKPRTAPATRIGSEIDRSPPIAKRTIPMEVSRTAAARSSNHLRRWYNRAPLRISATSMVHRTVIGPSTPMVVCIDAS